MSISRRMLLAAGAAVAAGAARAQAAWPAGPFKAIITAPVGGGSDLLMRLYAPKIQESLGQPLLVDPRPGANGAIGVQALRRAPVDGLTLLLANSNLVSAPILNPDAGYKLSDVVPVCLLCAIPLAFGVRPGLGATTMAEFLARARAQPGKLTYGSTGHGTSSHFLGEMLNAQAGVDITHVPYKGEAPAIQDFLGGQIDAVITSAGTMARHGERVRMVAVAGASRVSVLPDVPTFIELQLPDVNLPGWAGIVVAAGTSQPVVARLASEFARITRMPDVAAKVVEQGSQPLGQGPEQLAVTIRDSHARYARIVAEGRVKI